MERTKKRNRTEMEHFFDAYCMYSQYEQMDYRHFVSCLLQHSDRLLRQYSQRMEPRWCTIYPLVSYLCRNEEFSLLLCTSGQRLCTAEGHTSSIKDVVWISSNGASE